MILTRLTSRILCVLGLMSLVDSAISRAEDVDPAAKVRIAYREMQDAYDSLLDGGPKKFDEARTVRLRAEFVSALSACDWKLLNKPEDLELLSWGLPEVGSAALSKGDGKRALSAYTLLVTALPQLRRSFEHAIVSAQLTLGDAGEAEHILLRLSDEGADSGRAFSLLRLGDVRAVQRQFDSARASWRAADAASSSTRPTVPAVARSVEFRTQLVGKPACGVVGKNCADGASWRLSDSKGTPTILVFVSTSSMTSRDVLSRMPKLASPIGLGGPASIVGVTREYSRGYMPASNTKDPVWDGESIPVIPAGGFQDHLQTFRSRSQIRFPMVIVADDVAASYGIRDSDLPVAVFIDRSGTVIHVTSGLVDEAMLRFAVRTESK